MTEWRTVPSWPSYEANECGQIRRRWPSRAWDNTPLAPTVMKNGYLQVKLFKDGRGKNVCAHVAVCEAFHGPKPTPRHEVAHGPLSRNRGDNRPENLRWATRTENMADAVADGTTNRGSRSPHTKLTEEVVLQIRERGRALPRVSGQIKKGLFAALAADYGITGSCLRGILSGRRWRHI